MAAQRQRTRQHDIGHLHRRRHRNPVQRHRKLAPGHRPRDGGNRPDHRGNPDRPDTSPTFTMLPTIDNFTPTSGPAGTSVTITGSGFTGATDVTFNGTSAGSVGVGFTVDSTTQITATLPAAASTGAIRVTTSAGHADSSTDFTVT
jgi:IPT/TIG domain